jgi:hypothetical protein
MDAAARKTSVLKRTAKSYCPDAPRQASSSRKNFREATESTKPGLRGDCEGNRNTIVRGMPERFGLPVVTMLVCFHFSHTRLRVRMKHPAFPAPSCREGQDFQYNSGEARRENAGPCADQWLSATLAVKSGERRKNRQVLSFPDFGARTPPRPRPPHPWRLAVDENGPRCGL